ncbi:hypothetical protein H8E07_18820 [bacterium]|nr:hypothetical protein [bacterium]
MRKIILLITALCLSLTLTGPSLAGSLDIPVRGAGLSIGNSRTFTGLGVSSAVAGVETLQGALITGAYLKAHYAQELTTGAYNHVEDSMTGLQIGLFNRTKNLHGVQIGLLNYAGNNPSGLKWLPGVNAHF